MKKLWVVLFAGVLLACACPSIPIFQVTLSPEAPSSQEPLIAGNLTVVRLEPSDGELTAQLQTEALKASALGQHMFVEFDASW